MSDGTVTASEPRKRRRGWNPVRKGAEFEREVKRRLESLGWFVLRSGGSRSPADLMCLTKGDAMAGSKPVALVQCKCTDRPLPKGERLALIEIADRHRMVDVFWARPGGTAGSVELVNLVDGQVYELPASDDDGRPLSLVGNTKA